MSRPRWFVWAVRKTFPSRFTLARLTRRFPRLGRVADNLLFEGDDIIYLPWDRVIEVGEDLPGPDGTVLPSRVIEHFIDRASFLWVMDRCICREASSCRDYPIDLGCLFLGEAARGINPKLGHEVDKEGAREHLRRCREAGLIHLVGRNKLDTVWLGVKPGRELVTVCSCCPCCCLWRMLPELTTLISGKVSRMPGVSVEVGDDCRGCGRCTDEGVCFVRAIELREGKARITDGCRGCGRCVEACPHGVIHLKLTDPRSVELAIERLEPLFDL